MPLTIATPDGQRIEWDRDAVVIGTDPACDLCLAGHPALKPRHARVQRVDETWQIDALEGGSLQVNSGPWSISHVLKPGDVIRLSKSGPEITFHPGPAAPRLPTMPVGPIEELDAFRKPAVVAAPSRVGLSAETSTSSVPKVRPLPVQPPPPPRAKAPEPKPVAEPDLSRRSSLLWVAFIATVALISGGAILFFPPGRTRSTTTNTETTPVETDTQGMEGQAAHIADSGSPRPRPRPSTSRVPTPVEPETETPTEPTPSRQRRTQNPGHPWPLRPDARLCNPRRLCPRRHPSRSTAACTPWCCSPRTSRGRGGSGPACAVSDRQLATSAAIVLAAEHLRQDAKVQVVVVPFVGDATLPVIHLLPHPGYRETLTHWGKVQSELATISAALQKAAPEEAERLNERQARFQQHADQFARQQLWYDVGLLTVADALPFHLHIGLEPTFPDTPAKLLGLPFPADSTDADKPKRQELATHTTPWGNSSPGSAAWTVVAEPLDASLNWSGSPVLGQSGNLLGIYSRPAEDKAHLVTDAGRVRELLVRP